MLLYVGNTRFRGRAVISQEVSILLFHQMNRHPLTIPHTHAHTLSLLATRTHTDSHSEPPCRGVPS